MTTEVTRAQIVDALLTVAPDVDVSQLDENISFRDQYEIDSIDFLNFVLTLEKTLETKVPDVDYPRLSSLGGCLHYFSSRE